VKVAVDLAAAFVLLILAAPVIALLAILVRAGSRGPGIYRQVRLGRGGRPFTIYKIRTMVHDCELATGPTWSLPGDSRVTGLGRFLRRTHLDELPQLWNVLRGEMSLVGPRPERPEIIRSLERVLPRYRDRLAVRPGVTGLAQVQLPPDTDVSGVRVKLDYDLCYIARMGFWLDARLVAATALKVAGVPLAVSLRLLALPIPGDGRGRVRKCSAHVLGARTA
jgi:lipopolysaccharide/colanic/teichoic acid biosynthesis glycosyltransferase